MSTAPFDDPAGLTHPHMDVRLSASAPRRFLGVAMLSVLGALLVYLAFSMPAGIGQIVILLCGAFALSAAVILHRATGQVLVLTREALQVEGGPVLAQVADMVKVERGAFAFKPSNGFLLTVARPQPRGWAPGLYWRMGRRIGVGGVTGAPQSKAMAEAIAGLIALRGTPPAR